MGANCHRSLTYLILHVTFGHLLYQSHLQLFNMLSQKKVLGGLQLGLLLELLDHVLKLDAVRGQLVHALDVCVLHVSHLRLLKRYLSVKLLHDVLKGLDLLAQLGFPHLGSLKLVFNVYVLQF